MAIRQLSASCWVPSWPGDDRGAGELGGGHYDSPDSGPLRGSGGSGRLAFHKGCGGMVLPGSGSSCTNCGTDLTGAECASRIAQPRQLTERCWAADCDGECGQWLAGPDEGRIVHGDRSALEARASAEQWVIICGLVFCPADTPACARCGAGSADEQWDFTDPANPLCPDCLMPGQLEAAGAAASAGPCRRTAR